MPLMSKSYSELLRDPRWQRKRLEIMQRDEWRCQHCGADGDTLEVHHVNYERGAKPWEYGDVNLITLCETCHEGAEQAIRSIRVLIGFYGGGIADRLLGYGVGITIGKWPRARLENRHVVQGFADATGVDPQDVRDALDHDGWLTKVAAKRLHALGVACPRPFPQPLTDAAD